MALNKGIDSYVTLEEADEYVRSNFVSSSPDFKIWDGLEDNDKEVLLRNSASCLNKLKYSGSKKIHGQKLAFPRKGNFCPVYANIWVPFVSQYYDNTFISNGDSGGKLGGLDLAIEAQIKNAVAHAVMGDDVRDAVSQRRITGIKSRSASSISESYDTEGSDLARNISYGIYTEEVYHILSPWLNSSYTSI